MMYGQDRYRRRYWVLPHCGGVFIEAMESGEGRSSTAHATYEELLVEHASHKKMMQGVLKSLIFIYPNFSHKNI